MMLKKRRAPNKEEAEPELTEDEALPAVQTEENTEPAAVEPLQNIFEAEEVTKECVDRLVEQNGVEKTMAEIEKCKVVKLRNLAREYDGLQIAGREISRANKTTLLEELKKYYNKDS